MTPFSALFADIRDIRCLIKTSLISWKNAGSRLIDLRSVDGSRSLVPSWQDGPRNICTGRLDWHVSSHRIAMQYDSQLMDENRRYDPQFDRITHIDWKWRNNRIESDQAALKRFLGYRQNFRSLQSAKATQSGIETIWTIKHGHIYHRQPGVKDETKFIDDLFPAGA